MDSKLKSLNEANQVLIPVKMREKCNILPGDLVGIYLKGDSVRVTKTNRTDVNFEHMKIIGEKGRVHINSKVREKIGVEVGGMIQVSVDGNEVVLRAPESDCSKVCLDGEIMEVDKAIETLKVIKKELSKGENE